MLDQRPRETPGPALWTPEYESGSFGQNDVEPKGHLVGEPVCGVVVFVTRKGLTTQQCW